MAQTSNVSNAFGHRDAYRAAMTGNLATLKEFCSQDSMAAVPINASGDTVYHILARNFHAKVARELIEFHYHDLMTIRNSEEETVLHEAARVGCIEIADLMLEKQGNLITVRNKLGATPIFEAAAFGQEMILRSFFEKWSNYGNDELKRDSDGSTILHAAVIGEFYGLALLIMETYPDLCLAPNEKGITALHLLAQSPLSFRSGTIYSWLNLGSSTFIPLEILAVTIYSCVPIDVTECIKGEPEDPHKCSYGRMKQLFKSLFRSLPWLQRVIDAKQKHKNALEVVKRLVAAKSKSDSTLNYCENHGDENEDPLLQASKCGIIEIVQVILEEFPDAIEVWDKISGKNMLHLVAEFRQDKIFEFLLSQNLPIITTKMLLQVDKEKNTPLHLAAKYGFHQKRHVIPILHLIPSEMFWFQRIRHFSPRQTYHLQNAESQTPQELFDKTHYGLIQKSEKWVKENAGVYMVISTLIASLMFTAALTVPGGFDSKTGLPVLIHNKYLLPYFRLVSLSLFFSLATLAISLYTHCIHFQPEDFYFSLPLKIFLGSSNLFCCVVSTVLAYGNARRLEPLPVTNMYVHNIFEAMRFIALLIAFLVFVDVMLPMCCFLKKLLFHSLTSKN